MPRIMQLLRSTLAATALLTAPALIGCGEPKEGFETAKAASEELDEELGVQVHTKFEVNDGEQTVIVTLPNSSGARSPGTQVKVLEIVRNHFPEAKNVEIKF